MNKQHFAILLAAFVLAACGPRPTARYNRNLDEPMYYAYNPEDTVGNEPYWLLLRIDSARVDFRLDYPVGEMATINLDSTEGAEKTPEQQQYEQSVLVAETEAKWFELMRLCSQRQYEDALSLYIKEETDIGIALGTSTNKFDLDYFVIGPLLFEQLDEEEAAEIMVKFLENDKMMTEGVVALSTADGGGGYITPHYPLLIKTLGAECLNLGNESRAEDLIEPLRNAVYMLSDDVWDNEQEIAIYKIAIYHSSEDFPKLKAALEDYRAFVIDYSKTSGEDHEDVIGRLDFLIKELE